MGKITNIFLRFGLVSRTYVKVALITVSLLLSFSFPALAVEIAIFKSKNLAKYNYAIAGFKINCQHFRVVKLRVLLSTLGDFFQRF